MTKSQQRILDQIAKATGWKIISQTMIRRTVWIEARRDRGNVFLDEQMYGTIGVKGKIKFEYRTFGRTDKIDEVWMLDNVLPTIDEALEKTKREIEYMEKFVSIDQPQIGE